MTCEHINFGDGGFAILCTRGKKWPKCKECGQRNAATKLCDGPAPSKKSGTCDLEICTKCAVKAGPDRDLCPSCFFRFGI